MEENLQRIFSVLICVIIFFLLPLYMTFEKKDDISYALALKITTSFVDNVKSKGYMSLDMYNKFVGELAVTDNVYEISLEHISKRYYPVIYDKDGNKFDHNMYKEKFEKGELGDGAYLSYDAVQELYTHSQIFDVLGRTEEENKVYKGINIDTYKALSVTDIHPISNFYGNNSEVEEIGRNRIYTMNTGDEFNVIIRNKNTTIATVLFNAVTFGVNAGNNTKVYINYGATIQNEEYRI